MQTTVKTGPNARIKVMPWTEGKIMLQQQGAAGETASHFLTPDQAGALIFGIEQALEAAGIQRERLAHA